jgi:hypothetical protein
VAFGRVFQCLREPVWLVTQNAEVRDGASESPQHCRQHRPVRVKNLRWPPDPTGGGKFVTGRKHGNPDASMDPNLRHADGDRQS